MPIPDSQLETWANQGAITSSQTTHTSIRNALSTYKNWLPDVKYDVYLQGSYANSTNIYGNSDVDLVVELTSIYYSNLTNEEKTILKLGSATYTWTEFRKEVITSLINYYGADLVDTTGKKSVKVLPNSGRLKADVVISASYSYYEKLKVRSNGIILWTQPGWEEIVNYPKVHLDNGANKNSEYRTNGWYKHTVRTYKNAREKIYNNKPHLLGKFPSYFIECLLYNVPDTKFGGGYGNNLLNTLNWVNDKLFSDKANEMECQNGINYLFSGPPVSWNLSDAKQYITEVVELWNGW